MQLASLFLPPLAGIPKPSKQPLHPHGHDVGRGQRHPEIEKESGYREISDLNEPTRIGVIDVAPERIGISVQPEEVGFLPRNYA